MKEKKGDFMDNIRNEFLEIYKNPVIKTAINIIIICFAIIMCYRLGVIVGETYKNIFG